MNPTPHPESRVRALWRVVAVQLGLAALGGGLGALGGLLVISWVAGMTSAWRRPSLLPLLVWSVATGLLVVWLWRLAVRARVWDRRAAAAEIEQRVELPRGTVQAAVEPGLDGPGISRSLVELHRARVAQQLGGRRVIELGGRFARAARSFAVVGVTLALAATLATTAIWLTARSSAYAAWAAVLHPVRQLTAPPLPGLRLVAGAERVRRGRDLPVTIYAPERDSVQLVWQPAGEVAVRYGYAVSDGEAVGVVPGIDAPTLVWARSADGASSDTLDVTPDDPLLLVNVQVDLRYPPHTGREREIMSAPLPPLVVPTGSRATVSGVTTRALAAAALRDTSGAAIGFEVSEERRFSSSFRLRSGTWGWEMTGSQGESLEGAPDSLYVTLVPDSAPFVRISFPGMDTVLSTEMIQPLVVEVVDDYGLSNVELVSWRVSTYGERWPERVEPIPVDGAGPSTGLTHILDARGRGFLPGDTLHYFVRAFDNATPANEGTSREYVLRLPSLDEVRERALAEAEDLVEDTERLADRAREQEESAQALQRSGEVQPPPGVERQSGRSEGAVEFKDTEAARQALDEANELLQEAREIQESLRELQQSIENAGLNDTSVLERLREIESLYERILTPELEAKIEQLRQALVDLDPAKIREAIRELAEGSTDFRERIEQSLELLRRAALETEFETLETRAEELSEAHDQLADALSDTEASLADSLADPLERRAGDLSQRADALAEQLRRFREALSQANEPQAAERAAEARSAVDAAAGDDRQTAASISSSRRTASQSADQAAAQMRAAASALQEGREGLQERWRQEVVQALSRAQTEAMELARRQQGLNERLDSNDPRERAKTRSDEVAIKRGVDQLGEQLEKVSRSSLLLDQQLAEGPAVLNENLERLLEQLGDGSRANPADPRLGGQVAEALNDLAYRLMQAGDAAASARSGTGLQEALEQLAQLAEQQGELNAEAGGMSPGAMGELILQELRRLAAQQRAIAQELMQLDRSMGPRGQVLGELDGLGEEAEELARQLESGRLDERVIERQGRLFQRLLDAGRTLERDEFDRERRAERPGSQEVLRPGELPPELLRGTRFPLPSDEVLRGYPPAYRRLILEYFDRLNGREGGGGS